MGGCVRKGTESVIARRVYLAEKRSKQFSKLGIIFLHPHDTNLHCEMLGEGRPWTKGRSLPVEASAGLGSPERQKKKNKMGGVSKGLKVKGTRPFKCRNVNVQMGKGKKKEAAGTVAHVVLCVKVREMWQQEELLALLLALVGSPLGFGDFHEQILVLDLDEGCQGLHGVFKVRVEEDLAQGLD